MTSAMLIVGCEQRPFDEKVSARNDLAFSMWLSQQRGSFSPDDLREITEAQKQIKLAVMTDTPGLSAEEFTQAVYADIDGHTVREVMLRSLEVQAARINGEIAALQDRDERYQKVDLSRLSSDQREFLEGFKVRMTQRRADLQRLEERKTLVLAHR